MEPRQPRRIRDIAHLYLSGARSRRAKPRTVVVAAASSRDDLPGFHVANLAVALAAAGRAVCVVERSGLVLNAARFLALPPRVYLSPSPNGDVFAALAGVRVTWSGCADDGEIALVHAAPGTGADEMARMAREHAGEDDVTVVVRFGGTGRDASSPAAASAANAQAALRGVDVERMRGGDGQSAVGSARSALPREPGASREGIRVIDVALSGSAGDRVPGWRRLVADPVPVALRDPQGAAARAYARIASSILRPGARAAAARSAPARPVRRVERDGMGRRR